MPKKLTTHDFKEKLERAHKKDYALVGEYTNARTKVRIKHLVCNNIYETYPKTALYNNCPFCASNAKKTTKHFIDDLNAKFPNQYTVLGEYKNRKTKIKIKHNVCGTIWFPTPTNILQGHGCPNCANLHRNDNNRLTLDDLRQRTKEITNDAYKLIGGEYKNNTSELTFVHKECNQTFKTNWLKFSQGSTKCPNCRGSLGEQIIKGYLQQHHFNYEYAYLVNDLVDVRPLHFDFYLEEYNVAIEYDGIQHYDKSSKLYNETIVKHDGMKNKYCLENHINLIRIPYYENINQVLDNTLLSIVSIKDNQYSLTFKEVSSNEVEVLMLKYHYLHRKVPVKFAFGLYLNDTLKGMITYSTVNKTTSNRIFTNQANLNNTLELSRLYIKDEVSQNIKNITSKFIAYSLKQLKAKGNYFIISFADSGMNHSGSIYQATNFKYLGKSKNTGMYAWGGLNKYRERWQKGAYYRYLILPSDKYLYVTLVGNKKFKKHLNDYLKLSIQVYPKLDKQHYQIGEFENRKIKDRETGIIYNELDLVEKLKQV